MQSNLHSARVHLARMVYCSGCYQYATPADSDDVAGKLASCIVAANERRQA